MSVHLAGDPGMPAWATGVDTSVDSLIATVALKLAAATAASTYAPLASPAFTGTVSGVTKAMVGLGSADNTTDALKPASTAQAATNVTVAAALFVSQEVAPAHKVGLRWYRPSTKVNSFSDGTTWIAGGIGSWVTYVATVTGFAVGTTASVASTQYRYEGDLIRLRYVFKFGTAGAVFPTSPTFTLPITSAALPHPYTISGIGSLWHATSNPVYTGIPVLFDAATCFIFVGSPLANISPTAPFIWVAGDVMSGELTYRPL